MPWGGVSPPAAPFADTGDRPGGIHVCYVLWKIRMIGMIQEIQEVGYSLLLDDDNCHMFYVLWKMGMIQDGIGWG